MSALNGLRKELVQVGTHLSVVNLFSLEEKADMNCGDSLNARKLSEPWELLLTSCTSATVLSLGSFW